MNPTMPAILAIFQMIWIYYGVLIDSRPIILWNVVAVFVNSLTVAAYVYYKRRENNP